MAEKIKNIPSPDILMNSLRSIGYSFKTAVADIIDNSISADAKNIWIDFPSYSSDNLYITILDDAIGMDDAALFNAMKYGSERDEYGEKDLGRFGVGLKSASLSQCRTLTVMSKFNGDIHAYRWDLDEVLRSKEWECLRLDFDEIQACPNYEKLNSLVQGTMVVWQNFDIADQKSNGHAYEYLSEKLDESESHLCLIFHRFMNRSISPVSFFINDRQLKGLDPFLEGSPHHKRNPKTDEGKPVEMAVKYYDKGYEKEAMIKVQTFILPHQDDLSKEDVEALGGMEVLKDEQGFFVYRNDRLIIYGTWFRLSSRSVNAELYKYGRIKVDIPNKLDSLWDIDIKKYFDIYDDVLKIGRDIARRMHIDYVNAENDESIDKINLIIITNQDISNSVKELPPFTFLDKKVGVSIWSTMRFFELYQSGREREPIVIKTERYGIDGIPCIKADMVDNIDYDAYLAIVPGEFLHKIYYDHGPHLLEGNVRAFLSNRGKINRGIRNTIRTEPTKFFTYNNGIACTAAKITLSPDGHKIVEIEDLQIINGGQTTASLTSAVLKDKLSLDNIFVPMKMTVVKNDDYDTMIQNISKYANSQNTVTDADFFSNHPFHRTLATLSTHTPAPAKDGSLHGTYWYYERSRGKYEQEQFKLYKKSDIENFKKKYPKCQVVKKEELAKYYTAAELLRPDRVSAGSQKVMKFFAEIIDKKYQTHSEYFNTEFFKKCICYTILYRETDRIVNKAEWYNVGGYKLNIVPYTISKIISSIPTGYALDFERIWRKQELYPSLVAEINRIAQITNEFIQKSEGVIVTEYCKKEDTWNKYNAVSCTFSQEFISDLIPLSIIEDKIKAEMKSEKLGKELNVEGEIVNLGGAYWRNLIAEGLRRKILSPMEIDLLNIAASIDTPRPRIASPKQAKLIWKIRKKLEDSGVLV